MKPSFSERYSQIASHCGMPSIPEFPNIQKAIRINTHKITKEHFLLLAKKNGWTLTPIDWEPNGFFINRDDMSIPLGKTPEYFAGLFYIQEPSSMLPARILSPEPDNFVLDMAAAPGSKTTQLSNQMQNSGIIIANDFSKTRIKALATNIERLGCTNVGLSVFNGCSIGTILPDTFNRILLDAPCSGEGMAYKNRDFFSHWSIDMIKRNAIIQKKMILSAFEALRVDGVLVYSTCTFAPEENEAVVEHLLQQKKGQVELIENYRPSLSTKGMSQWQDVTFDSSMSNTIRMFPDKTKTGGFFVAALHKTDTRHVHKEIKKSITNEEQVVGKEKRRFTVFLKKTYGIPEEVFDKMIMTKMQRDVWVKPYVYSILSQFIRLDRCGTHLFVMNHDDTLKLTSIGAFAFGHHAQTNICVLNAHQTLQFMSGYDIPLSQDQVHHVTNRYVIVKNDQNFVLGTGLIEQGARLKNQIPRHFVL